MDITFLGQNCVRLSAKDLNIVFDPYDGVKTAADVALLSTERKVDCPMVIDSPGEYEVKGAQIVGAPVKIHSDDQDKGAGGTAYSVVVDGMNVAFLGNVAPDLGSQATEALGTVDILFVPVGNHGLTLGPEDAAKIVSQLEPKYVIPTHYDDGKSKYELPQEKVEAFLKEVGSSPEPLAKLRVLSKDLPLETTVVVLENAS